MEYRADSILKDALAEYLEREWQALPPEEEIWRMHRFSAGFLRSMRRLTQTDAPKRKWLRYIRRAAAVAAAGIILAAGIRFGVSTQNKSSDNMAEEDIYNEGQADSQEAAPETPEKQPASGSLVYEGAFVEIHAGKDGCWILTVENRQEQALAVSGITAVYYLEADGTQRCVYEAVPEEGQQLETGEIVQYSLIPREYGVTETGSYRVELMVDGEAVSVWITE